MDGENYQGKGLRHTGVNTTKTRSYSIISAIKTTLKYHTKFALFSNFHKNMCTYIIKMINTSIILMLV